MNSPLRGLDETAEVKEEREVFFAGGVLSFEGKKACT